MDTSIVRVPALTSGFDRVKWGASAAETYPSMASVNANYTDFNQAVALYNRRTNQAMTTPDVQPYFDSTTGLASDAMAALRARINTLRGCFQLSPYTWARATIKPGMIVKKNDLDELFNALNFSSVRTVYEINGAASLHRSIRVDNPYGTLYSETEGPGITIGREAGGVPYAIGRYRTGFSLPIPLLTGVITPPSATFYLEFDSTSAWYSDLGAWYPVLYASNTNDSAFPSGWQYNLDHLIGTATYGASDVMVGSVNRNLIMSLDASYLKSRFGSTMSLILGSNTETTGTGAGADSSGVAKYEAYAFTSLASYLHLTITFNYGW